MLGDEGRKRLHPWRAGKREDQRVSGAVCRGADAAWGPLHGAGVRSGLDAVPEKCVWRDSHPCLAPWSSMGRRQLRPLQPQV